MKFVNDCCTVAEVVVAASGVDVASENRILFYF